MALFSQYAIAAAEEALQDSGWKPQSEAEKERTGVCLGSGIGNFEDLFNTSLAYHQKVRGCSFLCSIYILTVKSRDTKKSPPSSSRVS